MKLEGLTIRQAELLLQKEYARFYQEPFVILTCTNKRVIVLGASQGAVIPLPNENTRLTEILALSKSITNDAKVKNIRVLRGDQVMAADLSTVGGYLQGDYIMQAGDIVYVEPVRRPFSEAFRDYGPVFSVVTSLTTLVIVIIQLDNSNN
jgi:polysaccharide export outer membrane protein